MNEAFENILDKLEELQNYACFPTEWVDEEQSKIHSYYANKLTEILKLTEQYNNGVMVVPSYLCTPQPVDKNNYKEILIDTGYYTEDQLKD